MRPMAGLHREEFSYKWVQEQVRKKDYKPVQQYFDAPYDREPASSKIPAGALEFTLPAGLEVKRADVLLASASAVVEWSNGMVLKTFVHATKPVGWFRFEHVSENLVPELIAPRYSGAVQEGGEVNSLVGDDLYLQWRYSMDKVFLKSRAYPWFRQVCTFFENITIQNEQGSRQLPISSSPEIRDNRLEAWFPQTTNYDLALIKFGFQAGSELATVLGDHTQAQKWRKLLAEFPPFAHTENSELMFAPTLPYNESHRHFSHLMAIHPLGLIKWEDGEEARKTIGNTIALLDKVGPDYWCGYSYSWLANLKARAKDGEGARKALEIFAKAFCLPNSFHANGDQTKSGLSKFTYRPLTLEGNFAFASGLQEMMLQSYAGFIEVMPALPEAWKNAEFKDLRAEGAVLVSATKREGKVVQVAMRAEKDGEIVLKKPFGKYRVTSVKGMEMVKDEGGFLRFKCRVGGSAVLVGE